MSTLYYILISTIFIDSLIGLYAWLANKLKRDILPLALAITCSLLGEIFAYYFKVKFRNNLGVYFIGGTFEYALFVWFIYANINSKWVKKAIITTIIVFSIATLFLAYPFIKESYTDPYSAVTHHNYAIIIQGLFITIFCICYFKGIFDSISRYEFLNVYTLLAVAGLLFYYAFSTVYFAAETYLVGLSLKENPHFLTDMLKRKSEAFTYAAYQLYTIRPFLMLTNLLSCLCVLVVFVKSAFSKKTVSGLSL